MGIVYANMEQSEVGPFGQSEGGSSLSSSYTERTYFQSHMASYGTGPVGAEEGINSIEITILDRDDPNNNPLVLDDGVVEFDFNIIWVEDGHDDDHGDDDDHVGDDEDNHDDEDDDCDCDNDDHDDDVDGDDDDDNDNDQDDRKEAI